MVFSVSPYLKPISTRAELQQKPFCSDALPSSTGTLDHLTVMVLRNRLPNSPEMYLAEWLGLMAGDQDATIGEIGVKIRIALQEVRYMEFYYNYGVMFVFRTQRLGY